ncbi:MAG: hypothetical protein M9921_11190 [Fimbriimonadaceae bacterium]|nr:hypothetical protein [Fimbriimonadaceae bacterium]
MKLKNSTLATLAVAAFVLGAGPRAFASPWQEPQQSGTTVKADGSRIEVKETKNGDGTTTRTESEYDKKGTLRKQSSKTVNAKGETVEETEFERDAKGKTTETHTKGDSSSTREEYTDKNGTKQVKETDREKGKVVREKTTTTDANGNYEEEETDKKAKTKRVSKGTSKDGKKVTEDKTEVKANGTSTRTKTEYYPDGKPKKVDDVSPDGRKTTSSTEYDKDGKPKKKTEYDGQGRKSSETEYGPDGKPVKKTDYDPSGRPTSTEETDKDGTHRKTEYKNGHKVREIEEHPDGSRTETEYKNGKPVKTTKFDKNGKPMASLGANSGTLTGVVVAVPDQVVAGAPMVFSAATLSGNVIAPDAVQVTDGQGQALPVTRRDDGSWVAEVPSGSSTAHVRIGDVLVSALVVGAGTLIDGKPSIRNAPKYALPGSVVSLGGSFGPSNPVVKVNDRVVPVLASSPASIKFAVPADVTPGSASIVVEADGIASAPATLQTLAIAWDAAPTTLVLGQAARRNLRVIGTTEPVAVMIEDPSDDAATIRSRGVKRSTGGATNVVAIELVATRIGAYSVQATLADGESAVQKDRGNAEAARADAAGWRESAKGETNAERAQQKRNAAANAYHAAEDWDAAAKAREAGDLEKAQALEEAARHREDAARAWGSSGDADAAAKSEKAAKELDGR